MLKSLSTLFERYNAVTVVVKMSMLLWISALALALRVIFLQVILQRLMTRKRLLKLCRRRWRHLCFFHRNRNDTCWKNKEIKLLLRTYRGTYLTYLLGGIASMASPLDGFVMPTSRSNSR